jgi:hypothetical protein
MARRFVFRSALFSLFAFLWGSITAFAADPSCAGGGLKTPQEYCANFSISANLANDQVVQSARGQCENFYQEAINSVQLLCSYKLEALAVQTSGTNLAAGVTGQNDSLKATSEVNSGGRSLYFKYLQLIEPQHLRLENERKKYKSALDGLVNQGTAVLKSEVHCEQSGTPNSAEGAQIIGLSKLALEWEMETFAATYLMLGEFSNRLTMLASNSAYYREKLQAIDQSISTSSIVSGSQNPGDLAARGEISVPGYSLESSGSGAAADKAAEALARGATKGLAKAGLIVVEEQVAQAASTDAMAVLRHRASEGLIRSLGVEAVGGAAIAVGLKVIIGSPVDALTIGNLGIGVIAAVAGVSTLPGIGLALAADLVELQLRKITNAADAKIISAYLQTLKNRTLASSTVAAGSYSEEKKKADYCKKCNAIDAMVVRYCPARNQFNPHWLDTANKDHPGRPQTWIVPDPYRNIGSALVPLDQ